MLKAGLRTKNTSGMRELQREMLRKYGDKLMTDAEIKQQIKAHDRLTKR